jgi:V/A-type H+/Na+-transporting ATPase subunit I
LAIAQLSRVTLACPRGELGVFLARLCESGCFHPSEGGGLVQDTGLLLLSSRAHAAYSVANSAVRGSAGSWPRARVMFRSGSVTEAVAELSRRAATLAEEARSAPEAGAAREALSQELLATRDAALAIFNDVSRVRVRPGTRRLVVTEGFVPTRDIRAFSSHLGPYILESAPVSRRQPGTPYIPTLVVNPRVVRLFEGVTFSLGVPKYNEVDPTPVLALVFPLFFGLMFSDLGRGLVLLAIGAILLKWKGESQGYLGRLLLVLGSTAAFVGALRGLFFGVLLPYPAPLPSPGFLVGAASIQSVTFWLEVGIVVGTFHLSGGYVLAIVNKLLSRDYAEAFLGILPTLVLYAATIPLAFALVSSGLSWEALTTGSRPTLFFSEILGANVPTSAVSRVALPVIGGALVVLVLGRPLASLETTRRLEPAKAALLRSLADAIVRPAELLIHTVSYVRLGILLVVSSVFGELLGGVIALGPVGLVLAVPANLAVVGIEAFVVYVQDLRLNVYEWSSKFYSGLGRPFSPLSSSGETFAFYWGAGPSLL